jgi:hypothetical protein
VEKSIFRDMTELDLIELLHDLCSQPQEQQWLEFKLNGADHEQIGEYTSAMSNIQSDLFLGDLELKQ